MRTDIPVLANTLAGIHLDVQTRPPPPTPPPPPPMPPPPNQAAAELRSQPATTQDPSQSTLALANVDVIQPDSASAATNDDSEDERPKRDWGDVSSIDSEEYRYRHYYDDDDDEYVDEDLLAWKDRMVMEREMPDQVHLKNLSRAYTGASKNSTFAFGDVYTETEDAVLRIWRDCSLKEMGGKKATDDFSEVMGMKG